MGIRGLKRYLALKYKAEAEALSNGSSLMIDALGWLFYVIDNIANTEKQFGGTYSTLIDVMSSEICSLQSMGFELIFFVDGDSSRMKDATAEKRRRQREEKWLALYHATLDDTDGRVVQSELPSPPLSVDVLDFVLSSLGVKIVLCSFEADQDLAIACQTGNLDSECPRCYCYGSDTDYFVMKDCPYIEFGTIVDHRAEGGSVSAPVTRRKDLANALNMTEEQLVEWCILIGNDFTEHFERRGYTCFGDTLEVDDDAEDADNNVTAAAEEGSGDDGEESTEDATEGGKVKKEKLPKGYSEDALDTLRDIITSRGAGFYLSSTSSADLQRAVSYSRAVYELQDISSYPVTSPDSSDEAMRLTKHQKHVLRDWMETQEMLQESKDIDIHPKSVASHALAFLRKVSSVDAGGGMVVDDGAAGSNTVDDAEFPQFTDAHLRAVEEMVEQLCRRREDPDYMCKYAVPTIMKAPKWSDVTFANLYQLICREILKKRPPSSKDVSLLYDGKLFHFVIRSLSVRPPVPPPVLPPAVAAGAETVAASAVSNVKAGSLAAAVIASVTATSQSVVTAVAATSTEPSSVPAVQTHAPAETDTPPLSAATAERLPIDNHREEILKRVGRDRVTIIHGETGCGKSSRLPVMLLQDAEARGLPCRMMVSQPRRIAASSLMKRLRTTLGDKVGMRMGHGIRDDSEDTQICFVTTGYLVRLMAHHPEAFRHHTHLIIDEVHERSVDGDLLCLLARRLLVENTTLRLILMSATVHTVLYKDYFSKEYNYGDMDCLSVGVRRFPLDIKYADDLSSTKSGLPSMITSLAKKIADMTTKCGGKASDDVPLQLSKDQYSLAVSLIRSVGQVGSGILVFVSGIADITELTERFEGMSRYKLYAIHSDLPFEEQEAAFNPAGPDEVKVVIATNAAESSITLPDVDCVICLGTHKALRYHATTHRVQLVNTWISKASATQRAGRTGRVRPGSVYRLYSKELHEKFQEHEQAEVHRKPLQDVILGLRNMLEDSPTFEGIVPLLKDLLEPPDMSNVTKSFDYLHYAGMITAPDDSGELTSFGRLSGQLPVDLQLGRLIAYGVALGVGAEAVVMAASLSQPKSLFRIASPMIHTDPNEYNAIVQRTFLGCVELDGGTYSEPIMYLNMFMAWQRIKDFNEREAWLQKYGVVRARMRQFVSVAVNLRERVQDALRFSGDFKGHDSRRPSTKEPRRAAFDVVDFEKMVSPLSSQTTNALRLALTWTSEGNVIRQKVKDVASLEDFYTARVVPELSIDQLSPLFPKGVNWKLETVGRRNYEATLSAGRRSISLVELLGDLAIAASSSSDGNQRASVVWLVQQSQLEEEEEEEKGNSKGKKKKKAKKSKESRDDSALVALAIDTSSPPSFIELVRTVFKGNRVLHAGAFPFTFGGGEKRSGDDEKNKKQPRKKNGKPGVAEAAPNNGDQHDDAADDGGVEAAAGTMVKMDVFVVENPSSKELKQLRKLHDDLPVSISMLVPSVGKAKVVASNCVPKRSALCRLFFGEYTSYDEMIGFTGNSEESRKSDRYMSEQVVASSQRLFFPLSDDNDDERAAVAGGAGKKGAQSAKRSGKNKPGAAATDTPAQSLAVLSPLIQDVPLGIKLLNSYRNGYRDKKMKVWKNPHEHPQVDLDRPNYSQSRKQSASAAAAAGAGASEKAPGGGGDGATAAGGGGAGASSVSKAANKSAPADDEDRVSVTVKCLSGTWQNLTTLGGNREGTIGRTSSPMALLPKQSVPAVAVHWGRGTLYGVAHHTMMIGSQGGMMVGCEGVTVLPPGSRWLNLALNCISVDTEMLLSDTSARDVGMNDACNEQERKKGSKGDSSSVSATVPVAVYDYPLTEDDVDLCDIIGDILEGLPSSPVKPSPTLSEAVEMLFAEWISGKSTVSSSARRAAAPAAAAQQSGKKQPANAPTVATTSNKAAQSPPSKKLAGAAAAAASEMRSKSSEKNGSAKGGKEVSGALPSLSQRASPSSASARSSGREVRIVSTEDSLDRGQRRNRKGAGRGNGRHAVDSEALQWCLPDDVTKDMSDFVLADDDDDDDDDSIDERWKAFADANLHAHDDGGDDENIYMSDDDDDDDDDAVDDWEDISIDDDGDDIDIDDDDDDELDFAASGGGRAGAKKKGDKEGKEKKNIKLGAGRVVRLAATKSTASGASAGDGDVGKRVRGSRRGKDGGRTGGAFLVVNESDSGDDDIISDEDDDDDEEEEPVVVAPRGSETTSKKKNSRGAGGGQAADVSSHSYSCPTCKSKFASNKACLAHLQATSHLSLPNQSGKQGSGKIMNFIEKVCRIRVADNSRGSDCWPREVQPPVNAHSSGRSSSRKVVLSRAVASLGDDGKKIKGAGSGASDSDNRVLKQRSSPGAAAVALNKPRLSSASQVGQRVPAAAAAGDAGGAGGRKKSNGDTAAKSTAAGGGAEKTFTCKHCGKSRFTSVDALNSHVTAKHSR